MLYFAYGSNLLESRLRQPDRAPSAQRRCRAVLAGYSLRFQKRGQDGSGKCDCLPASEASSQGVEVHGLLWKIRPGEQAALDRAEGLGHGYEAHELEVRTPNGGARARMYLAHESHIDPLRVPFDWYRDLVLFGARAARFPEVYLAAIATVSVRRDPDPQRAERMRRLLPGEPPLSRD